MILGGGFLLMAVPMQLRGEGVEVSGKILMITLMQPAGKKHKDVPSAANVVVWLSPLRTGGVAPMVPVRQPLYRLVYKDKRLTLLLLVRLTSARGEVSIMWPL